MSDESKRIDGLSPDQQTLLTLLLQERKKQRQAARDQTIPVRPRPDGPSELSFGQQRLWFLDQWEPGCPAYNIPLAVQLSGALDHHALRRSLNEIVRRHEILRTIFVVQQGRPVQAVAPELDLDVSLVDLQHEPAHERPAAVRQVSAREARAAFDLARGPLLRATLLRLSSTEHVLLITMHHIVSDGWSNGVLFRELGALYQSYVTGQPAALSPRTIQYADFAAWQRQWLQGDVLAQQLSYWKTQLADAPPLLELATDRPRPASLTFDGARFYLTLPPSLVEELKRLSQREGASLFMVLLSAFKVLLYHYTEQTDLLVGSPIANRNRAEIEELIGFFVNTLVLRTQLSGDMTFRQLVQQVRTGTVAAYSHQDLPFEKLVEELQVDRDMSHTPFFQVVFVLQNTPMPAVELPGLTLSLLEIDNGTTQFDLMLELYELDDGLRGSFQYNTALFDEPTIARMATQFEALLAGIVADADQQIQDLPLLTDTERQQILVDWNATQREVAEADSLCIHTLFERQAVRQGAAIAAVCDDQQLSYDELNQQANQIAYQLRALGVGPGALVAVYLQRSIEMIPALLGILKAGAAYVPLEPSFPNARIAWILSSLQIRCLVTQRASLAAIDALQPDLPMLQHIVCVDRGAAVMPETGQLAAQTQIWTEQQLAQLPTTNPAAQVSPDDIAYIIFTSGSTGTPKGVTVRHRPVINLIDWINRTFAITSADRVLFVTSLCFDLSVYDVFGLLAAGGSIQVVSDQDVREPERLVSLLHSTPVTFWDSAPAALQQITPFFPATPRDSRLRLVFLSGDWIPVALPDVVRAAFPTAEVVSLGGATEATVWSNFHRITTVDPQWVSIPYGRPIQNARYYILDEQLQPKPVGVAGDLYIGGDCLAWCYANDPALTAQKFIPDPFSPTPGGTLYRTGDRARFWPDGTMEFLGRLDHQVKVRGFRVELGEIETVLSQHPNVREAAVLARSVGRVASDRSLVAYVVPQQPGPITDELRRYLRERLPEYMVPAAFVALEQMPVTANGKLDRSALPVPERSDAVLDASFVTPRNSVEDTMAGIWAEVLELERVGVHDNFFELGGHSLLATHVLSRVINMFQVELPLRALFDNPTIAGLSAKVEAARAAQLGLQTPPIEPLPHDKGLPLSLAQERLWLIDQLVPGNTAYISPGAARITGPLDPDVLERSFNEVLRRHAILHTNFVDESGVPKQVIVDPQPINILRLDLRHLPIEEREAQAQRAVITRAQQPFDLRQAPLIRVSLVQLDEQDYLLGLATHHIVYDLMSIGVFTRELRTLYEAFSNGQPSPLPELTVQYADFAAWQHRWLRQAIAEAQLPYWLQQMRGANTVLELPADRLRPPMQSFRGARYPLALSLELTRAIKTLSTQEGVSLFMTLLATFKVLLYRYTGQTDLIVGAPNASRNRAEVEGLIGFFVNILALRSDLSGNPTFRELLGRVRETALGAYTHQDLPFVRLVEELQPERDLSRNPIFQVMFNFLHNYLMPVPSLMDLKLDFMRIHAETEQFDLSLDFWERPEGLRGSFDYNTDLFDESTIARMGHHLLTVLEHLVTNPDIRIDEVVLLDQAEQRLMLVDWNGPSVERPREQGIHQLFAAQAARTPEAVAVVADGDRLTYAELNQRANQMAHYLQKQGVGPETRVGICVEPSLEMLVGLFGILKVGAAYVPLDPMYPAERLAFMLQDAQITLLLTQAALLPELPELCTPAVCLDRDWPQIARESGEDPQVTTQPDHLAYIIYTSGSTGRPKGAMIPHAALVNYTLIAQERYSLTPQDRVLQFASINFDASAEEIYPCLTCGATLVLRSEEMLSSAATFLRTCKEWGVTLLDLPTVYWHELMSSIAAEELSWPECVRLVIIGGERALPEQLAIWQQQVDPAVRLVNTYGPTESTIVATMAEISDAATTRDLPIGQAVANVQVYILDRHLQITPTGVPGEIYLAGTGLARGYLHNPALSAEKFIPHPYSSAPGARLYRTGDLGRYRPDGQIEFMGRNDHQVKIRGFRIELGEVEAALLAYPAVRDAAVMAREDTPGDKRLVAYVVGEEPRSGKPAPGSSPDGSASLRELRDFLTTRLPGYMIPAAFVFLDALPLLPNGKLDRRALPAPSQARPDLAREFVAPRSALEEVLAGVWGELLNIERVSIYDSFFELGGHSLLATQLISRLRETFGVELSLQFIFKEPTVAGLAATLVEQVGDAARLEKAAQLVLRLAQLSDDELDTLVNV